MYCNHITSLSKLFYYTKMITNDIYYYIFTILFIYIGYLIIKELIFNIIFE
jgi:hypothetical protein